VGEVTGRPKHLWSIYKKMKQRDKPYEDIYDLLAIRVLVGTIPECYHALGVIHEWWTPVQERIKDYIAQPKSNGYQSLHTTVFGPGKQLFEIQIRTRDMHRTADYGIAAHWRYKEGASADDLDRQLAWFRQVLELQLDATDPGEFLEFLKLDLYQDEIFVFTPTGDVIQLPKGATPIDFAFAVHTQVGLHCAGAKVNGRIAPLARQLKNSETVEILTAPVAKPSRDWLAHVRTSRARHKIRQWLRQEEEKTAATVGREILDRELRRRKLAKPDDAQLAAAAKQLKLTDAATLIASLGRATWGGAAAAHPLPGDRPGGEPKPRARSSGSSTGVRGNGTSKGVRIQGADGLMVRSPSAASRSPATRGWLRHARARRQHPPRRLPEPADAVHEPERRLDIDCRRCRGSGSRCGSRSEGSDRRGLYADVAGP
jgi:GTP pyrophosphokinase